jgi:hypothetical protein
MADIVLQKSIGELVDEKALISSLSWTAGGASDDISWTGLSIDREGFSTGSLPRTMDAVLFYDATLGSGKTLSIGWDIQDSPDGSNWSDYATEALGVVATGVSGGGRAVGVARLAVPSSDKPTGTPGISLSGARRYVRFIPTADMSATGTDTAVMAAVGVFAGFDQLASPQT